MNLNKSYQNVDVSLLREHPRNPNKGDVDAIAESIQTNGFYGACVVQQSTGYVLAGNHRFKAAKQAGLAEIPVIYVDCDDTTAHRVMVADNRTARLGSDDPEKLLSLLQDIERESGGLIGTGYDEGAAERLLGELQGLKTFDLDKFDDAGDEPSLETETETGAEFDTPLAIVLNPEQLDRWRELRKARKCRTDTELLLRLMDGV